VSAPAALLLALLVATMLLETPVGAEAVDRNWAWLGVRIRDLSEFEMDEISRRHGIREGYGVVVVAILDDSPAASSAIRAGDIVVDFAGRPIVDARTFQRVVSAAPVDRELPMTVFRHAEGRHRLTVRLAPMPLELVGERVAAEFGFFIRDRMFEEPGADDSAATVGDVQPGGLADRGGLRSGDILREVNGEPLRSFRHAAHTLARASLDRPLHLVVERAGAPPVTVTVAPPRR
jgi:serine protease Do